MRMPATDLFSHTLTNVFPLHSSLHEEIPQHRATFGITDARGDFAMVIERGELEQIQRAARRAGLWIRRAENDASQPRVNDCAGAHRARFLCHIERAVREPPVADGAFGLREREHFCVGSGVFKEFDLIEGAGNDAAPTDDDGANGDFLRLVRARGLAKRFAHEVVVALKIDEGLVHGIFDLRFMRRAGFFERPDV
jgi:hypothetical protein